MGDFQLFEGEATVQIFSPLSGEMMVSYTSRGTGTRSVDALDAERSAVEKALDDATKVAISRGLQKSRKILVHRAIVKDVKDQDRLLTIMNYMASMKGVYHVRQLSFDPENACRRAGDSRRTAERILLASVARPDAAHARYREREAEPEASRRSKSLPFLVWEMINGVMNFKRTMKKPTLLLLFLPAFTICVATAADPKELPKPKEIAVPEGVDADLVKEAGNKAIKALLTAFLNRPDVPMKRFAVLPLQQDVDGGYFTMQLRNGFSTQGSTRGYELYTRMDDEFKILLNEIAWGQSYGDTMDPATVQEFGRLQGVQGNHHRQSQRRE